MLRSIIEKTTKAACYFKRHRMISPAGRQLKINLGCGLAVAKGWINVDGSLNALVSTWPKPVHKIFYSVSGANRYYSREAYCSLLEEHLFVHHDLSYGIPFPEESADFVYTSHFLEHLHKVHAMKLLNESYRVLKPGGTIRICVPDLACALTLYSAGQKEKMLENYFFIEDNGNNFASHKYMYDFDLLRMKLAGAGFTSVARREFREGLTPDLDILDNRQEDTLYVEASK